MGPDVVFELTDDKVVSRADAIMWLNSKFDLIDALIADMDQVQHQAQTKTRWTYIWYTHTSIDLDKCIEYLCS
jgi:hypothetical protein